MHSSVTLTEQLDQLTCEDSCGHSEVPGDRCSSDRVRSPSLFFICSHLPSLLSLAPLPHKIFKSSTVAHRAFPSGFVSPEKMVDGISNGSVPSTWSTVSKYLFLLLDSLPAGIYKRYIITALFGLTALLCTPSVIPIRVQRKSCR